VRVEESIGQRVRARRNELHMSQDEFGRALGPLLGKPWSRQTVSMAEQGSRAWVASDLLAVAVVLQTTVGELLRPPLGETAVDLGGPESVPGDTLRDVTLTRGREDLSMAEINRTIAALHDIAIRGQSDSEQVLSLIRDLDTQITHRIGAGGVVSLPWAPGTDPGEPVRQAQPIVAAIVTSPDGVLVTKRRDGKPPWGFVTGEVEPGELPADAAVREVKEETGLLVLSGAVIGERDHPQTGRHMIYMACAPTNGLDVAVGDEAELEEVRWVSLADADKLLPGMYQPVRDYLAVQV
jgi:8-oxo-dGTP pyrophosphatase MutT (NUDIX family)/transcriptional regulator with XRE-family HTH domain